jgi:hypothetical protein
MKSKRLLLLLPVAAITGIVFAQGPLTPPGAPAPVMKTLDQIEPRTPISSLPFIISESGSYYLTRNLNFTAPLGDAIFINASYVTLDLMGFTLSSSDAVTGAAIRSWEGLREIEVRNGAIVGGTEVNVSGTAPNQTWTVTPAGFRYGIDAASPPFPPEPSSCHFSHLRISRCRVDGLNGGELAVVEQVTAAKNGNTGISLSANGSVANCTASWNGNAGILSTGGSVTNCVASSNGSTGISSASVANSTAERNGANGIGAGNVTNCNASFNGSHGFTGTYITVANSKASSNGVHGINAINGSLTNCTANSNGSNGINASGVIAFCTAANNNTSSNGSVNISASATRTGNNPTP